MGAGNLHRKRKTAMRPDHTETVMHGRAGEGWGEHFRIFQTCGWQTLPATVPCSSKEQYCSNGQRSHGSKKVHAVCVHCCFHRLHGLHDLQRVPLSSAAFIASMAFVAAAFIAPRGLDASCTRVLHFPIRFAPCVPGNIRSLRGNNEPERTPVLG